MKNSEQSQLIVKKEAEFLATALEGYLPRILSVIGDGVLTPDHFSDPRHKAIWKEALRLHEAGRYVDWGSILPKVDYPHREELGQYLIDHVVHHDVHKGFKHCETDEDFCAVMLEAKKILLWAHSRRKIAELKASIEKNVNEPLGIQLDRIRQGIDAIGQEKASVTLTSVASLLRGIVEASEDRFKSGEGIAGLSTGLENLDVLLGGLKPSNLIVLGARPAMGKTTLMANIASNICREGKAVLMFSLEMSAEQIAIKALSSETGVSYGAIENGDYFNFENSVSTIEETIQNKEELGLDRFFVVDTTSIDIADIVRIAKKAKKDHDIACVMVDYLSIVSALRKEKQNNLVVTVTYVTEALKGLAKDLKIPVLVLSQLSRDVEKRDDKRPVMSDLRESGGVEQGADVVMFLYRHEYYHRRLEEGAVSKEKWRAELEDCKGRAEIIVAKNRTGIIGTAHLTFNGRSSLFRSDPKHLHSPHVDA